MADKPIVTRGANGAWGPLRAHTVVDPTVADAKGKAPRKAGRRKSTRRGGLSGPEARQQKAFVRWAREHGLEVQHQNNGASTKARRVHLHAMGCTAGAADLLVFDVLPRMPAVRGLALEFKSDDGEQTDDQERWQRRVERLGWRYHLVRTKEDAIEVVTWYGLPASTLQGDAK